MFLLRQVPHTLPHATLFCTWGSGRAAALRKLPHEPPIVSSQPSWSAPRDYDNPSQDPRPVDSVGAGDTFIAAVLYGILAQTGWGTDERLVFATELAGRKVYQEGFAGLGAKIRESEVWKEKLGVVSPPSVPEEDF